MTVRQDSWSHEDDLLLAETVLRHIREGSTQLKAFEEVGHHLNRTAAACGFRWNAEVRDKYKKAIELAKKQRKERQRLFANQFSAQPQNQSNLRHEVINNPVEKNVQSSKKRSYNELTLDQVILYLQQLKQEHSTNHYVKQENKRLRTENQTLKTETEKLKKKVKQLDKNYTTIQEDYQSLIQIMDRARKMVLFKDEDQKQPLPIDTKHENSFEQMAE